MKVYIALLVVASQAVLAAPAKHPPALKSGTYKFQHRFAEHPDMKSFSVIVKIHGSTITIVNPHATSLFPEGVLAQGRLTWHSKSRNWIIATEPSDAQASEVGGCSNGPEIVDLQKRVYWTC